MPCRATIPMLTRIAVIAMAAAGVAAQTGAAPVVPQPDAPPRPGLALPELPEAPVRVQRSYTSEYSEAHSRALFGACDEDRDDRLDVFEVVDAFDTLRSLRDAEGFARFDTDRDGFVTWPEFDHRFRQTIENGQTFRVRTLPGFAAPEPKLKPLSPLQQFIRQFDIDGDGALGPEEVKLLLDKSGLPPSLGEPLLASDLDRSGTVDATELAPWFQALPPGMFDLPTVVGKGIGMPPPWAACDADGDGAIDREEFARMLRRLDPGLLRWAGQLFDRIDADHDDRLAARELPAADGDAGDAGAANVPPEPQR